MAVISLLGTLIGSGSSILAANKLISYRLSKLEEIVKERDSAIQRTFALEKENAIIREKLHDLSSKIE